MDRWWYRWRQSLGLKSLPEEAGVKRLEEVMVLCRVCG